MTGSSCDTPSLVKEKLFLIGLTHCQRVLTFINIEMQAILRLLLILSIHCGIHIPLLCLKDLYVKK